MVKVSSLFYMHASKACVGLPLCTKEHKMSCLYVTYTARSKFELSHFDLVKAHYIAPWKPTA